MPARDPKRTSEDAAAYWVSARYSSVLVVGDRASIGETAHRFGFSRTPRQRPLSVTRQKLSGIGNSLIGEKPWPPCDSGRRAPYEQPTKVGDGLLLSSERH